MGHRLADVHLAGCAPAFTLSLCDSEYARNPPVPIASVVMANSRKRKNDRILVEKSLTNCPLLLDFLTCRFDRFCWLSGFCSADNSSQILKGKNWTFSFYDYEPERQNLRICGLTSWKQNFRLCSFSVGNRLLTAGKENLTKRLRF